ncbi:hypothetical protein [Desulfitibacter alkalitolerans]|uniref:hypothetical protein n=1 Tax=Desulfitibacter alkalitolerans TaxID=264641 RepID=UPI00054D518B|nr:hypothetical protein [Desulfitibacter alkalitolerans]
MEPAAFETVDETVEIDIADKDEESLISHINEQEGQEQEQDQNPDQNQSQELNQVQDQEKEQSLIGSYHTQYVIEGLEKLYKIYQKKKEK